MLPLLQSRPKTGVQVPQMLDHILCLLFVTSFVLKFSVQLQSRYCLYYTYFFMLYDLPHPELSLRRYFQRGPSTPSSSRPLCLTRPVHVSRTLTFFPPYRIPILSRSGHTDFELSLSFLTTFYFTSPSSVQYIM